MGSEMCIRDSLCNVSVIPVLILSALAESLAYGISEITASAAGLIVLFLFIAAAVAVFLSCSFKNAPYAFLDKEPFDTEYGVTGMVSERQRQYKSTHARCNMVGTMLCILSPSARCSASSLRCRFSSAWRRGAILR